VRALARLAAASCLSLAIACGGATAHTPSANGGAAVPPDPLPVAPMRLVSDDPTRRAPILELLADGSVLTGDGKLRARVENGRMVGASGGEVLATVKADGEVDFGEGHTSRFDAGDALVDAHTRVSVDDGGVATFDDPDGTSRLPARFVPFAKSARRTAVLLALFAAVALEPPVHRR
jgi:hypothetical protein